MTMQARQMVLAIRNFVIITLTLDPSILKTNFSFLLYCNEQGANYKMGVGFLDYRRGSGWFIVKDTAEAFEHLMQYTKREVRLHGRLQAKTFIAVGSRYQLSAGNPVVRAIKGMTPSVKKLEKAVEDTEQPKKKQKKSR